MNQPSFSLQNKVALVTGSTRGLGKAMAKALGSAGAKVAINCQNNIALGEARPPPSPRPRQLSNRFR
jgi:NAD(P)-dependent dehydrogenase (short-subunit alcohol dehydrogenase family)